MQNRQPNLFTREDTLFGVCEGLGEDLGINPLWIRLAFTVLLFFQPAGALAGYAAAGVLVLTVRLLSPNPRLPAPAAAPAAPVAAEEDQVELPLAA